MVAITITSQSILFEVLVQTLLTCIKLPGGLQPEHLLLMISVVTDNDNFNDFIRSCDSTTQYYIHTQ